MRVIRRSIVLIGFMGAGKSSVGSCLQRLTGLPRFDTDELVSKGFRMPITQIFREQGEEMFRQAEVEALRKLRPESPSIIITGGGIVLGPGNVEVLKELGLVVHLEADEETLYRRIMRRRNRPLLQTEDPRATVTKLLREREPLYRAAADISLVTTGADQLEVANSILEKIKAMRNEST